MYTEAEVDFTVTTEGTTFPEYMPTMACLCMKHLPTGAFEPTHTTGIIADNGDS